MRGRPKRSKCSRPQHSRSHFVQAKGESATNDAMNQPILTINGIDIGLGAAAAGFAVAVLALLVTIAAIAARAFRQRAREAASQVQRSEAMEGRIAELAR